MGYYTDYEMNAYVINLSEDGDIELKNVPEITLLSLEEEIEAMNVFEGDYDCGWYCNAKWYEWEADMAILSRKYPEVLFKLHGDGENPDDLWEAYFYEGKGQFCPAKIIYDEFDTNKLLKPKEYKEKYSYQ